MIDNYLNINSIDPIFWGKSGWIFLNSVALTYDTQYKDNYKIFFSQLPFVLPCKSCGVKLKNNLVNLDDALKSKQNLILWLSNIRNEIYESQQRPKISLTDNINEIFYKKNDYKYIYLYILIIIFVILIILFKNL